MTKIQSLLIQKPININQNFMLTQTFNIVDDNDKYFLSSWPSWIIMRVKIAEKMNIAAEH